MSKIKDTLPLMFSEWGFKYDEYLQRVISPRGKTLTVRVANNGYYLSTICCPDGSKVTIPIAQVAAYNKYGDYFIESGLHVRHLNAVKTDNSAGNIEIGTASQNENDKSPEERSRVGRTARAAQPYRAINAKLTPDQVRKIRSRLAESDAQLSKDFGVTRNAIYLIRHRKTYKDIE